MHAVKAQYCSAGQWQKSITSDALCIVYENLSVQRPTTCTHEKPIRFQTSYKLQTKINHGFLATCYEPDVQQPSDRTRAHVDIPDSRHCCCNTEWPWSGDALGI